MKVLTPDNISIVPPGFVYKIDDDFVLALAHPVDENGNRVYALVHFHTGCALGVHHDIHQLLGLRQRLMRWDWGGDQEYLESQEDALDPQFGYMHIISDFADIPEDPNEEDTGIFRRPDNARVINRHADLPTQSITDLIGDFGL